MVKTETVTRYRFNPVEIVFFAIVSVIFVNSLYHLVTFQPQPKAAEVAQAPREATMELSCGQTTPLETGAEKVRFTGAICNVTEGGRAPAGQAAELVRAVV